MKSISIKAEREYSVNFDRKWRDVIVEIAECSERLEFSRHEDGSEILGGSFAVTASEADD